MQYKKFFYLSSFFCFSALFAKGSGGGGPSPEDVTPFPQGTAAPWFTGPLLTSSAVVVPQGHQNYEPYIYWTQYSANYDSEWKRHHKPLFTSITAQLVCQYGIAPRLEFDFYPQFYFNHTEGKSAYRVGDLPFLFCIQLIEDDKQSYAPAMRLTLGATLPIGKYQRLNPKLLGVDSAGAGSYSPTIGLNLGKLYPLSGIHYLNVRFALNDTPTTPTKVHGFNDYGGGVGTCGWVYPGNSFTASLGLELSLAQAWAFALDVQFNYQNKTRFSGVDPSGTMKSPSSASYALAPALEYNFNQNIGLIGGTWFTVAGRNTSQFFNWVLALNVYI